MSELVQELVKNLESVSHRITEPLRHSDSRKVLIHFREKIEKLLDRKLNLQTPLADRPEYVEMQIDSFESWVKELSGQYRENIQELVQQHAAQKEDSTC